MAYSTVPALVDRYGSRELIQLSNTDEVRATAINEERIQACLDEASAELDGYIGVRRATPIPAPVPVMLKGYTEDVAIYKLTTLRSRGGTEDARKRYEDAMKWAAAYAKGNASLGVPETLEPTGSVVAPSGMDFGSSDRLFTRGTFLS